MTDLKQALEKLEQDAAFDEIECRKTCLGWLELKQSHQLGIVNHFEYQNQVGFSAGWELRQRRDKVIIDKLIKVVELLNEISLYADGSTFEEQSEIDSMYAKCLEILREK